MIRRPRASTVPNAEDLPRPARERRHHSIGTIHSNLLARTHARDRRRRVPAPTVIRRRAALHLRWPGAEPGRGGARAVGGPAARGAGALAGRLGAAHDVRGVPGARARDGGAAARGAVGGADADAGGAVGAVARVVDGGEGRGGEEEG